MRSRTDVRRFTSNLLCAKCVQYAVEYASDVANESIFFCLTGGVRNGTENNEHENVNSWAHQVRKAFR